MNPEQTVNTRHVAVLDGIRGAAVLLIAWFHFWQQSWLMPKVFGISLDWLPRTGYEMVDLMLLLSGFCLFLPHARHMLLGEPLGSVREFYRKRCARILPSYLFCILVVLFCFNLPMGVYSSPAALWKDLLTHLTFTNTFFADTYHFSKLNVVLWTVSIEVQFYLIFPLIAHWFRKKPLLVYGILLALSLVFNGIICQNHEALPFPMLMNQLPTFLGVYANGMMAALIFVAIAQSPPNKYRGWFCTALALFCLFLYWKLMQDLIHSPNPQVWQVEYRFPLSLLFSVFILSACFASRGFRFLFSNRLMGFMAGISFNFYIWHQFLAVKLKQFRIPYWSGDVPPNKTGDMAWIWQYTLLIWAVSLIAAVLTTYLLERPIAAWLLKAGRPRKKEPPKTV